MVHKYVRKTLPRYTEDAMSMAMHAVRRKKLSQRKAASTYKVPLSTLQNRLKGIGGEDGPKRRGGQLYCPEGLEEQIMKVIKLLLYKLVN